MDLNASLLGDISTTNLSKSKIFINYYLPKEKYNEFKKLRTYAKTIGLKYVWHRSGKFFTKKGDGERAYVFSIIKDLDRILIQSEKINKNKINTNVNAESGLQNENNNINNENVQKATYSNIIEEHDGIKHRKNKIKNKKTKNQKVTNTAIISNQNVSSPA